LKGSALVSAPLVHDVDQSFAGEVPAEVIGEKLRGTDHVVFPPAGDVRADDGVGQAPERAIAGADVTAVS
jgi:hypothetical protein